MERFIKVVMGLIVTAVLLGTVAQFLFGYKLLSGDVNVSSNQVTVHLPTDNEYSFLTLEVKQKHYNLNIGDHIKDNLNATTLDIPVDPTYYESVNVGDVLVSDFRDGSFFTSGSAGTLEIKVVNKYIK